MRQARVARDRAAATTAMMAERLAALQAAGGQVEDPEEAPVPNGNTAVAAAPRRLLPEPIDITLLDPDPDQPRKFAQPFSLEEPGKGVAELADTIRVRGLLQPILVYAHEGRWRIIFGEKRWRAFRLLEAREPGRWTHISTIIWPAAPTPLETLGMQIIENDAREAPDAAERRTAYLRMRELCSGNASRAIELLGIGRPAFYRVIGEPATAEAVAGVQQETAATQPKAASRLSHGQLTRALGAIDEDRVTKLNDGQVADLLLQVQRILDLLQARGRASATPRRRARGASRP